MFALSSIYHNYCKYRNYKNRAFDAAFIEELLSELRGLLKLSFLVISINKMLLSYNGLLFCFLFFS